MCLLHFNKPTQTVDQSEAIEQMRLRLSNLALKPAGGGNNGAATNAAAAAAADEESGVASDAPTVEFPKRKLRVELLMRPVAAAADVAAAAEAVAAEVGAIQAPDARIETTDVSAV